MKHLKKDDGYVLVYVLIVFTILSFVAVSICSTALNNLKAQKADVARMEARYEAEGYLQQFVAEVETTETVVDVVEVAAEIIKDPFWDDVLALDDTYSDKLSVTQSDSEEDTLVIIAKAQKSGYIATIRAKAEIRVETTFDEDESKATCKMENGGWKYISYDISYEEVSE